MKSPEEVVKALVPRLNETIFDFLAEAPFQGQSQITTEAGVPFKIQCDAILSSIVNYTGRILANDQFNKLKISLDGQVKGENPGETIKRGDFLTI